MAAGDPACLATESVKGEGERQPGRAEQRSPAALDHHTQPDHAGRTSERHRRSGAGGRTRTGTEVTLRGILSLIRSPGLVRAAGVEPASP